MKMVVLDTSALMRLFIPDGPVPDGAEAAIRDATRGSVTILVPELALAEVGQVVLKKVTASILKPEEARALLRDMLALPLQLFSHKALLSRALEVAMEQGTTVYDALFLSLAEKYDAIVVTADDEMRRIAQKMSLCPPISEQMLED